jgi:hypothetical protein
MMPPAPNSELPQPAQASTTSTAANGAGDKKDWPSVIRESAKTPPAFFSLALLVTEGILTIAAGQLDGQDRTFLVIGMVVALFSVIAIITYLTIRHPWVWDPKGQPAGQPIPDPEIEQIKKPSILCISTQEYDAKGFARGVAIVERTMGKGIRLHKRIVIQREANFSEWRQTMLSGQFEIVHIAAQVDAKDGSIDFGNNQRITASGFQELVIEAKTRLVVLATCDSIALGAAVSRITNMIASTASLGMEPFFQWAEAFYLKLAQGAPLSRAYEVAMRTTIGAPMVLLLKKDITFQ